MTRKPIERPTPEAIQAALSFIPSDDRQLWLKIGMGIKHEFDEAGFDLFDSWSQSGSNYDAAAVKTSWRSFKAGGKIGIGTVLYEAKQRGFNIKDHAPAAPVSAEQAASMAQERAAKLAAEQAETERKQAAAASMAQKQWDSASEQGHSDYLQRKGIAGHGVRFARHSKGDTLLIPVMDTSGQLCNIQRVFANGDKRFYTGGKVSGGFHLIGGADAGAAVWLLIAEGYATGAALYEATGYPVAIAFSASNLKHIAALMQQQYPDKRLLLCADDDSETEQNTGKNTGVIAAKEAAAAIGGLWCKPLNLPAGGNDFNDLAVAWAGRSQMPDRGRNERNSASQCSGSQCNANKRAGSEPDHGTGA
jgi:putative DNA primase/helicase